MAVKVSCKTCKQEYSVKPFLFKRGTNYCSKKCYSENHKLDSNIKGKYRRKSNGYGLHQIIWMQKEHFYVIPKGMIVHHVNGRTLDNRPENLTLLPKKYHDSLHQTIRKSEGRLSLPEV